MTVVSVDESQGLAVCHHDDGTRMTVEIGLVAPVSPAERLLVHAGTAIARIE
jgi:hydrogenase maturation factor